MEPSLSIPSFLEMFVGKSNRRPVSRSSKFSLTLDDHVTYKVINSRSNARVALIPLRKMEISNSFREKLVFKKGLTFHADDFFSSREYLGVYRCSCKDVYLTLLQKSENSFTKNTILFDELPVGSENLGYKVIQQILITSYSTSKISNFLNLLGWIEDRWFLSDDHISMMEASQKIKSSLFSNLPSSLRLKTWSSTVLYSFNTYDGATFSILISTKNDLDFIKIDMQRFCDDYENCFFGQRKWMAFQRNEKDVIFDEFDDVLKFIKEKILFYFSGELNKEVDAVSTTLDVIGGTTENLPVLVLRAMVFENTLLILRKLTQ